MTTPNSEQLVGNLIDLSFKAEESDKNSVNSNDEDRRDSSFDAQVPEIDQNINPSQQTVPVENKDYSRLCGYLNKLGNRAILKTFRKRWFIFCEDNCKLYYYRSPQDQVPLGEIDISQATFTFEVNNKERTGFFTISIPGRDYFLEASNRQTALFWLQELQKYRKAHSLRRTKYITEKSTNFNDFRARPQSGLLAQYSSDQNILNDLSDTPLMCPVDCPKDVIGEDSALNTNSPFTAAQQKFNSFCTQVKNTAQLVKNEKLFSDAHASYSVKENQENIHSPTNVKSVSSNGDSSVTQKSSKGPALSAFKLKLSQSFRKSRVIDEEMEDSSPTAKENCSLCRRAKIKIEELEEEVSNLRDEVTTSQEVRLLLQRQLDIASKEKETLVQLYQFKDTDVSVKMITEKDQQIVNLLHDVQEQKQVVEKLERQIVALNTEVVELQANNELFQEMLKKKDNTIVNLTNEIFELETDKQDKVRSDSISATTEHVVEPKEVPNIEDLKDSVQAFELQNKFLNHELLELNQLRRDAEQRVQLLSMKCSEWEARSYQIQSKLLFLLNEINKSGGNFNREIVSQLLEEAVGDGTAHTNILPSWSREKMYDDLGFNWRWGKDDVLSLKASNFKQKSEDITNKAKDAELIAWRTKWDNFIVSLGTKELQRSPELKHLVRNGIPNEYRGKIWKGCVQMWIKDYKSVLGPDYYASLLNGEEYFSRLDPSSKQIELDLLRTLPNNCHYENLDSDGIPKLRRVLLAYSRHNPVVGYCQGLNRLAAIALLFMDEEDAFWCLVAIIKFIMPDGYYTRTLISSHVDQKVLKDIMIDKLPRLHSHFEQNNVDLSLFTFNWFLTIFVDNVPVEIYLRIWDVFLYEGSKVLFRYALAFFKSCENEILQIKDYLALNKYLRSIAEQCTDIKKLTHDVGSFTLLKHFKYIHELGCINMKGNIYAKHAGWL
ncbi:TBC1 domain family member 2B [Caerostris darwini]|uniref:TBC1 domain family member 2B n=1 Tax=Caerostris darwini TaxID=1538125 RepID=A0AAV4T7C9_9ARAC|nr:TBC1 domain family member 2B [Caerostris darwini]